MCSRVGVNSIVFAKAVNSTAITAKVERVDTKVPPFVVALRFSSIGKGDLPLALGLKRSNVPEHDGAICLRG